MENKYVENAIDKAKNAFEVAYKKTSDVVSVEKLKIKVANLESKKNKEFTKLGEHYFSSNSIENVDEDSKEFFNNINSFNKEISELKKEISAYKAKRICPNCGEAVDENATFCSACGERITFDSKENSDE